MQVHLVQRLLQVTPSLFYVALYRKDYCHVQVIYILAAHRFHETTIYLRICVAAVFLSIISKWGIFGDLRLRYFAS
jgi:hypothetical protein